MNKGRVHMDNDDPRVQKNKKTNSDESVQQIIAGFDEIESDVEKYRRIVERRGVPQIEVLEDENELDDDAGFVESTEFHFNKIKNKVKGAWDEAAKPFRNSKQMKKELDAQEKVVKSKLTSVRREANRAMGMIAVESRQKIEEIERLNAFKEEQYRLEEQAKDKEIEEEVFRHKVEMHEMKKRFEQEQLEKKNSREIEGEKKAKKVGENNYEKVSRVKTCDYLPGLSRFSFLNSFQVDILQAEAVESLDVDREMTALIEIMARSKLDKLGHINRVLFRDYEDSRDFCYVFNRVISPAGAGDYKFSDFNSGMGEGADYYSVSISDSELEVVNSFKRKDVGVTSVVDIKRFE